MSVMFLRIWHVARTVLIEAIRRREIYVIVLVSCLLIAAVMALDFFSLEGLTKFYREFALRGMSAATAVTVIVLACRQLPREFESRTIYPLLARPIGRATFLLGKLLGVWLAAGLCLGLFMTVFVAGMFYLGGTVHWPLFAQYVYLQMAMMLILAALGFTVSMLCNVDAAITIGVLLYALGSTLASIMTYIYELATPLGQWGLVALTYLLPQLMLFDLSEKTVHAEVWEPLAFSTMATLTVYAAIFGFCYFAFSFLLFRRRAL
jgi:ABC-type transport system involved in multi-copper enzyme maturation permease subunit